ncbi:MAG: endonuclease III [Alphaproteobacteria bacterium]|nr:endonuclease III [Alphaproteobacteria bacterium]
MTPEKIEKFFSILQKENSNPKSDLDFSSPYTLLIVSILSAQSTDKGVNKATPALFKVADTPEKMVILGEEGLKKYIKTIGLYNNKAKNIIAMSKALVEEHSGEVPQTRKELESLPGVGRKTANITLNISFGQPVIAVDTHIFRISNRIGLCEGKTPIKVEEALMKIIPEKYLLNAHHWLVLHGRYICKAKKPNCVCCPVYELCEWEEKEN